MKIRYVGPFDEVEVREFGIVLKRNHQADVPDVIGQKLTEQADWEEVGKPKGAEPETEEDKAAKGG